jgi:trk system potassium uptake protein TrkA
MGCGRVGSSLAERLDSAGHSVVIVDQDQDAFRKLSRSFSGRTVTGIGFDRDALLQAGIAEADAFAAVSSGDNSNIISARLARERFNVPIVVARIYDPRRAEIYQRLGIETVASVAWTTEQIIRRLEPVMHEEFRDSTGTLTFAEMPYAASWIGRKVTQLESAAGCRIAYIHRFGSAILPDEDAMIQENDILHAVFKVASQDSVQRAFEHGPQEH